MSIHVLLVDDQDLYREGLHTLLSVQPGVEVVGEAANGEEALHLAVTLCYLVAYLVRKIPFVRSVL